MSADLGPYLERLLLDLDVPARLAADPVSFVHRFPDPADQEVAAILAGTLAYGRVAAFRPVLERLFAVADGAGGPRAWVASFEPERDAAPLLPIVYRWNRGIDWVLLLSGLRALYQRVDTLEALLPPELALPDALDALIAAMQEAVVAQSARCAVPASIPAELPRGVRYLMPRPSAGSATKRWWMILRWLVRPPTMGIDLGIWRSRTPAELVVPLDTHVLRISQFLGLTDRRDSSLRTALEITARLGQIDPVDPVRFDFALAHLGISGACRGRRDADVCPGCPLHDVCRAP